MHPGMLLWTLIPSHFSFLYSLPVTYLTLHSEQRLREINRLLVRAAPLCAGLAPIITHTRLHPKPGHGDRGSFHMRRGPCGRCCRKESQSTFCRVVGIYCPASQALYPSLCDLVSNHLGVSPAHQQHFVVIHSSHIWPQDTPRMYQVQLLWNFETFCRSR